MPTSVFVYKDGKVSYNKVELGRRMGTEYELKSGVPDNSQVVVAGQSRLVNGMEVEVEASSQLSSKWEMYSTFLPMLLLINLISKRSSGFLFLGEERGEAFK